MSIEGYFQVSTSVIGWFSYESFDDVTKAINREKQLKRWNRTTESVSDAERENPYVGTDLAAEWFIRHRYAPDKQVPPLASSIRSKRINSGRARR